MRNSIFCRRRSVGIGWRGTRLTKRPCGAAWICGTAIRHWWNRCRWRPKVEFFRLLTELGFKEIEVGFPAASETEFAFVRKLIEEEMIPDDVTIQVLTQAREKIIRRTFDALAGAKNAIVHVYNSVSPAQRKQVFHGGRDEVKKISTDGARLINQLAKNQKGRFRLEYSPESFTAAEPDFALEVCNAVLDEWKPSADKKAIINLPATVETALPHVFAQQVEFMRKNLVYPEAVVLVRYIRITTAAAASRLRRRGLLAGAGRVEGTLFGNGERTGNVDLVTLALNLFSHGVDPKLNFENLPYTAAMYSYFTGMKIPAPATLRGGNGICRVCGIASGRYRQGYALSGKKSRDGMERSLPAYRSEGYRQRI